MVSAASTTGTKDRFSDDQKEYFRKVDSMGLKNRRLIGFGISNQETFADACRYSSGAIIGSLFIKCLSWAPSVDAAVEELMHRVGRGRWTRGRLAFFRNAFCGPVVRKYVGKYAAA